MKLEPAVAPLIHGDGPDCEHLAFRVYAPGGRVRWLLECTQRAPWHLRTWANTNWRSRVYSNFAWGLGHLGLLPPARTASLECNTTSPYAVIRREFPHVGIFVGTPGPNRKIVVYGGRPGASYFIKIPTSPASARLVHNESIALAELSSDPRVVHMVPSSTRVGGHLALEDQAQFGAAFRNVPAHRIRAASDLLFARSAHGKPSMELLLLWGLASINAETIPAHRSVAERVALRTNREAIHSFVRRLPEAEITDCYQAHGDLTPWNVLSTKAGELKIIDWELYGCRPKHFDLIHYFASHYILVAMRQPKDVLSRLLALRTDCHGQAGITLLEWRQYLRMYFAVQSVYYNRVYSNQDLLHPQALWQLNCWTYCLNAV